jgi:hypothetical protein
MFFRDRFSACSDRAHGAVDGVTISLCSTTAGCSAQAANGRGWGVGLTDSAPVVPARGGWGGGILRISGSNRWKAIGPLS